VVDRFLEHSRIYFFLNGGDEDLYLASADWMARNLDRRVELMFPIETPEHKARILSALRMMFNDTEKSRWLDADGTYRRRLPSPRESRCRVQEALHDEGRRLASLALERKGVTFRPERADSGR
jgi:polyphosphate kinase